MKIRDFAKASGYSLDEIDYKKYEELDIPESDWFDIIGDLSGGEI